MRIKHSGQVVALSIGASADCFITTRLPRASLTFEGFEGDRHAGFTRRSDARTPHYPCGTLIRNERQISIVSREELDLIADELCIPELPPEWLGANLLLAGIPALTRLPPSARLRFSRGPVLVVQAENHPCIHPGKVIEGRFPHVSAASFPKAALHRRGVVACVERPGFIAEGDRVVAEIPDPATCVAQAVGDEIARCAAESDQSAG